MRNYLQEIEIVGATMCYQEGEQCRPAVEWLCNNCDRVIILLDNWDENTESIILEYKKKYHDKMYVFYSDEPVNKDKNKIQGQIKKRFKLRQNHIRERVLLKLHELNKEKPVDLFIFMDSDEIFINKFSNILEDFWYNKTKCDFMMLGFVEVYDSFQILISQKMAPHGRVFRYDKDMSAHPYKIRTVYNPFGSRRAYKLRHVIIHLCHLTEEYRKRRQFFDNKDMMTEEVRRVWFLPKDARTMMFNEIADYQPGTHRAPSKYPAILLSEYLDKKDYYNKLNNIKSWIKD